MRWNAPEEVGRLLFSPSGLLLATTRYCESYEEQDVLRLWDALRGEELARLDDFDDEVNSLAFVSERALLIVLDRSCLLSLDVLGDENRLARLDAATGKVLAGQKVRADFEWRRAALDPTGDKIALSRERAIQVLDLAW